MLSTPSSRSSRHSANTPDAARTILEYLAAGLDDAVPALRALRGLVAGALGRAPADPSAARLLALLVRLQWELPWERFLEVAEEFAQAAIAFENIRRDLEPVTQTAAAEAQWATWAFDYPPFRRAVPHGQAVRRDPNLDELVLTVVHETIHVVSMNSAIGETIIALRLALLELEFRLWTYMGPADPEAFTGAGVAPLRDGDLAALARPRPHSRSRASCKSSKTSGGPGWRAWRCSESSGLTRPRTQATSSSRACSPICCSMSRRLN